MLIQPFVFIDTLAYTNILNWNAASFLGVGIQVSEVSKLIHLLCSDFYDRKRYDFIKT